MMMMMIVNDENDDDDDYDWIEYESPVVDFTRYNNN